MSNTQAKRYRLKKDLPGEKAPKELIYHDYHNEYFFFREDGRRHYFPKDVVEKDTDGWFEEVPEPLPSQPKEFQWNDKLVRECCEYVGYNFNKHEDIQEQLTELIGQFKQSPSTAEPSSPQAEIEKKEAKDWEIVSVTHFGGSPSDLKDGNRVMWTTDDNPRWRDLDELLKDELTKIHSVRRLDKIGEQPVFTVGDETTIGTIKKFELKGGIMYWWNEHTWYYLNQAIKLPASTQPSNTEQKPVLFVTEDGVEIREGGEFFGVSDNLNWNVYSWGKITKEEYKQLGNAYKYFSTQEKANEYVLMNKPCLSVNELFDYLKGKVDTDTRCCIQAIAQNLAESKNKKNDNRKQ